MSPRRHRRLTGALVTAIFTCGVSSFSQAQEAEKPEPRTLNLEELLDVKVTSPGRKAEPWFYAPTAIELLSEDDIRRYGALTIPDTLRIVPGVHVARSSGNSYSVTTRGFSSSAGNKMQVLMDGRSLYTPFFSGVFWEVQDTLMMDLDRIEVIRGPGAASWGANAVNGVINIISREARETQGTLLQAGAGNEERVIGAVRYGGKATDNTYYRVYSKYRLRDDQLLASGGPAGDFSEHWQSGFRTDSYLREIHQLTFQGDFYLNDFGSTGRPDSHTRGGNILGRWTRTFSENSDLQLQAYYDRSDRNVPTQYEEERNTADIDLQHRFQIGERNDIVYGANYRVSADDTGIGTSFTFTPQRRMIHLANFFVQDEIAIVPDRVSLTLGTKAEHNDFTGFEIQPSARATGKISDTQVLWAAVSRAVRTPTRLEDDLVLHPGPGSPLVTLTGSRNFDSEDLIAYELGYRIRPHASVSLDVSGFYNVYDNLRSLEPSAGPGGLPFVLMNEREGETYGLETSARYQAFESWRLTASYTFIEEHLHFKPGSADPTGGSTEANDPRQMAGLRSTLTLPHRIEFDQVVRYVDSLKNPHVEGYVELDLRIAYRPIPGLELSIVGMNLLNPSHPEFNGGSPMQTEVQRSIFFKVNWLF